MNLFIKFWKDEEAIGVVEIILILVILVALVLVFKTEIGKIVTNAFKEANKNAGDIIG